MIIIAGESPGTTSGTDRRLAEVLGIDVDELIESVAWVNLWPHPGSNPDLYVTLIEQGARPGDAIVMLGRKVAKAFLLDRLRWLDQISRNGGIGPIIFALPHPSGRNLWWNDPKNIERAAYELGPVWRACRSSVK